MPEVHETFYRRIQSLWDELGEAAGLPWRYGEWMGELRALGTGSGFSPGGEDGVGEGAGPMSV